MSQQQNGEQQEPRLRGINTGTHFVFCGGRITIGPDYKSLLGTTVLIIVPVVIFCVWVLPWVGEHISWALVAISGVLIAFSLLMLAVTSMTDPGFIPRSPPDPDVEYGMQVPTKDHQINGYTVSTKYCTTCSHYRPPRCSHCAVCDNCVDKFDHHCPWVGTCIGRRNYRSFMFFISGTALLCCWVFALSIADLVLASRDAGWQFGDVVGDHWAAIVCAVYTFLGFWFVGGLTALHGYLVSTNQTTYEHFRHRYSADLGNPYNRGWLGNCAAVFCTPIPPRWGQLGMRQRVEAAEAASAEAARVQQEAMAAGMVPPGGGEVQMVPLPHAELEGGFRGSLKAADEAAAGSNGAGVEVLPYPDDEEAGSGDAGHISVPVAPSAFNSQLPWAGGRSGSGNSPVVSERVNTTTYEPAGASREGSSRGGSYHTGSFNPRVHEVAAAALEAAAEMGAPQGMQGPADPPAAPNAAAATPADAAAAAAAAHAVRPPAGKLLTGRTRGAAGGNNGSSEEVGTPKHAQHGMAPLHVPPAGPAPSLGEFGLQSPRPPGSS